MDLAQMKALFAQDRFATDLCGIEIDEVTDTGARCSMPITPQHINSNGTVQGGAIYTLCDFAFAGASWSTGRPCIGLNSSISYLRPGKGPKITATATLVHNGRTTCVCEAVARNSDGKIIAKCTLTGYFLDQKK